MGFTHNQDVYLMHRTKNDLSRMFVHHDSKMILLATLMKYSGNTILPSIVSGELSESSQALINSFPDLPLVDHSQYSGKYKMNRTEVGLEFEHIDDSQGFHYDVLFEHLPKTIEGLFEIHKIYQPAYNELVYFASKFNEKIK